MVNFQLLFNQRVPLNTRGFFRRSGLRGGFFRQQQTLAVNRFLQQLELMFKAGTVGGHVITLLLQGILKHRVARKAFALELDFGIKQRFLHLHHRLLSWAQRIADGGTVQAITHLQQLLRRRIHGVLHAFRLRLQRHQLTVVGGQIVLRILQVVNGLRHARFQLTKRQRTQRLARLVVIIDIAQRIQILGRLTQFSWCLIHLLLQLCGFILHAVDFIQQLERFAQVLYHQLILRRQVFLIIKGIKLILNISAVRNIIIV